MLQRMCPEAVKKAKLRKYFGSKNRKSCVKNGTAEVIELPLRSYLVVNYTLPQKFRIRTHH